MALAPLCVQAHPSGGMQLSASASGGLGFSFAGARRLVGWLARLAWCGTCQRCCGSVRVQGGDCGGRGEHHDTLGVRSWCNGDNFAFRLRSGADYRSTKQKSEAGPAMYRCVGLEVVQASARIESALGLVGLALPNIVEWEPPAGQLPHIIVVNFQVPFERGSLFGSQHPPEDHGCSVLLYFRIEPWAAAQARGDLSRALPCVRLLAQYLSEEDHPKHEGTFVSSCFKAVGVLMNADALDIPSVIMPLVRQFNGKPVLVEKETRRHASAARGAKLVELAVDIRGFNPVARSMLCHLRRQLLQADIQVGLLIQGCVDDELPEQLLGAVRFRGLDLLGARRLAAAEERPAVAPRTGSVRPLNLSPLVARLASRLRCPSRQACGR